LTRYASANDSLRRKQEKEREAAGLPPLQRTGGRGTSIVRGGRGTPAARGRGTESRGRSGTPSTSTGGQSSYGPRSFGGTTFDKNLWVNLVQYLKKNDLLPVVVFTFSKKRCEENANSLGSQDLCVAGEKSEIHVTVEKALTRLKGLHTMTNLSPV
jgi:antiviral helicase SKI2